MAVLKYEVVGKFALFAFLLLDLFVGSAGGDVVLNGRNVSLSFPDIEATFAPIVKGSGECGVLYVAEPLDACAPLTNEVAKGLDSPFALIIRGGCTFDVKVRNAQNAGFKAAIVYDNEDRGALISMAGSSIGIHIYAVFVSKASGEMLTQYAGNTDLELWIIPTFENSAWPIMVISFMALLVISAVLATCFFIRRHYGRPEQARAPNIREFHGMSSQLVKAMPSLIFTSVVEDNCTATTCAICLEDYSVGEKLRILPCHHKFHAFCVDFWLTTWRTFCPVCKQDARAGISNLPASECTPLLSSGEATASSDVGLSSFRSSMAASPAFQIFPVPSGSESNSQPHLLSGACSPAIQIAPMTPHSQSSAFSMSRSSLDLRNASPQRSHAYLLSSHSLGIPGSPSINSRLGSSHISCSSNVSSSYLAASSSRQSSLRHCTESGASLSALASAQSLPGC